MAINEITGDALISRAPSDAYKNNYDLIFRKKNDVADKDQKAMPTDYVIELAKQAGMQETFYIREELETFADIVRADALEQAAKICEDHFSSDGNWCAQAIRGMKCQ